MSKNDINFHVSNHASRRSLVASATASVTLVPVFSEGRVGKLPQRFSAQAKLAGFKGDSGQSLVSNGTADGATLVHFGIGKRADLTIESWRKALTGAVKQVASAKVDKLELVLPEGAGAKRGFGKGVSIKELAQATAETISAVLYQPNHYRTEAGGFKVETHISDVSVSAVGLNDEQQRELAAGLNVGATIGWSVNMARDTANEPPNICSPSWLASLAHQVARDSGGTIQCTVLEDWQCRDLGMNAFLAVAKGSSEKPKFIVMDYAPAQCSPNGPVLGIVGKSITFDSGGLDIKPADGMRDMKYDMCGGADVIAAMRAIAQLGLPIRVKAFCAATENMTGPSAYRPGDVYVGLDGKSYEIDNTDAEGRLTLVDAVAYARKVAGVTHVIDYATLTGAVLVALGDVAAGVFSNNQEFADKYLACAKTTGELAYQLPTWDPYKELNKSKIADMKNSGGRFAGSITAGLFVLSAAGDIPAIHVDIAGVAFRGREMGADPAGGTGWGVRTLVELARVMSKE